MITPVVAEIRSAALVTERDGELDTARPSPGNARNQYRRSVSTLDQRYLIAQILHRLITVLKER